VTERLLDKNTKGGKRKKERHFKKSGLPMSEGEGVLRGVRYCGFTLHEGEE